MIFHFPYIHYKPYIPNTPYAPMPLCPYAPITLYPLSKTMTSNKYIEQIKRIVLKEVENQPIRVIFFGSRAVGEYTVGSDVDIALDGKEAIDHTLIIRLKEKLEESTIPYKVDIIDLSLVTDTFRKQVLKTGTVWKNFN